jgi:hypothetical protein
MMLAVASKTLQQMTTARLVTRRSFAAASEKVWKVYLSGTYIVCAGFFLDLAVEQCCLAWFARFVYAIGVQQYITAL